MEVEEVVSKFGRRRKVKTPTDCYVLDRQGNFVLPASSTSPNRTLSWKTGDSREPLTKPRKSLNLKDNKRLSLRSRDLKPESIEIPSRSCPSPKTVPLSNRALNAVVSLQRCESFPIDEDIRDDASNEENIPELDLDFHIKEEDSPDGDEHCPTEDQMLVDNWPEGKTQKSKSVSSKKKTGKIHEDSKNDLKKLPPRNTRQASRRVSSTLVEMKKEEEEKSDSDATEEEVLLDWFIHEEEETVDIDSDSDDTTGVFRPGDGKLKTYKNRKNRSYGLSSLRSEVSPPIRKYQNGKLKYSKKERNYFGRSSLFKTEQQVFDFLQTNDPSETSNVKDDDKLKSSSKQESGIEDSSPIKSEQHTYDFLQTNETSEVSELTEEDQLNYPLKEENDIEDSPPIKTEPQANDCLQTNETSKINDNLKSLSKEENIIEDSLPIKIEPQANDPLQTNDMSEVYDVSDIVTNTIKVDPYDSYVLEEVSTDNDGPVEDIKSFVSQDTAYESASSEECAEKPVHKVGTLLWVRMTPRSSYWPALVTFSTEVNNFKAFYKVEGNKKFYHVSFYGAKLMSNTAWVNEYNIMDYAGSKAFIEKQNQEKEDKVPYKLRITMCSKETSNDAVLRADNAMQLPRESRFDHYDELMKHDNEIRLAKLEKNRELKKRKSESLLGESSFVSNEDDEASLSKRSKRSEPPIHQDVIEQKKVNKTKSIADVFEPVKPHKPLMFGLPQDPACNICLQHDKTKKVTCGFCLQKFHPSCGKAKRGIIFVCSECSSKTPKCFICNKPGVSRDSMKTCSVKKCSQIFHEACVSKWHQASMTFTTSFKCPAHTCHSCVSEDPATLHLNVTDERLIKCVFCPTSYHTGDHCIPAAAHLISTTQLVCSKHPDKLQQYKPLPQTSTSFCSVCTAGGQLAICETCPLSYHPQCVHRKDINSASLQCDECESGKFPTYGEIVWAKHGSYRWWPSRIPFPTEVSHLYDKKKEEKHNDNEFVIHFLGTRTYAWTSNLRVYSYVEGDSTESRGIKYKGMNDSYRKGLELAEVLHAEFKVAKSERRAKLFKEPPKYIHAKVNKIIGSASTKIKSEREECFCKPENPCGPNENCINMSLLIECPKDCPAGALCENRRFSKCQYANTEPFLTKECGWGLRTLQDLKSGDFVIEYVGEVIDYEELTVRKQVMEERKCRNFYFLALEKNLFIDAGPRGNQSRFINHSCMPNCSAQMWHVNNELRMGLFAKKDITKGTELTFDYKFEQFGESDQTCLCGAEKCTGSIGGKKGNASIAPMVKEIKSVEKKPKKKSSTTKAGSSKSVIKKSTPKVQLRLPSTSQKKRTSKKRCFTPDSLLDFENNSGEEVDLANLSSVLDTMSS